MDGSSMCPGDWAVNGFGMAFIIQAVVSVCVDKEGVVISGKDAI